MIDRNLFLECAANILINSVLTATIIALELFEKRNTSCFTHQMTLKLQKRTHYRDTNAALCTQHLLKHMIFILSAINESVSSIGIEWFDAVYDVRVLIDVNVGTGLGLKLNSWGRHRGSDSCNVISLISTKRTMGCASAIERGKRLVLGKEVVVSRLIQDRFENHFEKYIE